MTDRKKEEVRPVRRIRNVGLQVVSEEIERQMVVRSSNIITPGVEKRVIKPDLTVSTAASKSQTTSTAPLGPPVKERPPKPSLKVKKDPNQNNLIIVSWTLNHNPSIHAPVTSYQLYSCQQTAARPGTDLWKRVGDGELRAMPLPMACTLQFSRSVMSVVRLQ